MKTLAQRLSDKCRHFFHQVSNIRPIIWISLYVVCTPIFALIYWALPDGQFRIPDGGDTDFGSWIYYSIVTITTLGFGDYTPAHGLAQLFTACEVMCGLIFIGLFLNAVGAMKSEIDVESEIEKQRMLHEAAETDKLKKTVPIILHHINTFLAFCYAVTTPVAKRKDEGGTYNPDFTLSDMADLYKPSGLNSDASCRPAVEGLLKSASRTSLFFDSVQNRIDISLWPNLLEDFFSFVANEQMFASTDVIVTYLTTLMQKGNLKSLDEAEKHISETILLHADVINDSTSGFFGAVNEIYRFIKKNAAVAISIEATLTRIASANNSNK